MRILLASIYPYAFFLLLLIIPFDDYVRAWPNILLGIILVAWPFAIKKTDFKKLRKAPTTIIVFIVAFLFISSLTLGRMEENMAVVSKISLSVGLLFLYLPVTDFKKVHTAIIFSSLIAIGISSVSILMVVKETGTFDIWDPLNPIESLLIERLYLGLLCVLSIIVSYQSMGSSYSPNNKYYLFNIAINVAFVFLIVSRFAILALLVLVVLRLLYGKAKPIRIVGTLAITTTVVVLAFVFNDNVKKRFLYITPTAEMSTPLLTKTIVSEPRTVIWECAIKVAETNDLVFTGIGFETTKRELRECYQNIENETQRDKFLQKKFNAHNQFLDTYLSAGVIPLLAMILLFVITFLYIRKDFFSTALLFTIVFFSIIENIWHRQMGAYYFGIILILLLIQQHKKTEINS